ncbi:MAG: methyl-accepting chemotaxis protein, partial [Rhodospirillales bacterium]|nr:methyl-accepting chemotaxis protein [Rhodospirillales bacterium]
MVVRRDLDEISAAAMTEVEKNKVISANMSAVAADMAGVLSSNRDIMTGSEEILRNLTEAKKGVDMIAAAAQQA